MGIIKHIVKIRFDEKTGSMMPVDNTHCPMKNGLVNACVAANGVICKHMIPNARAKQLSDRHYMMHCGFTHG